MDVRMIGEGGAEWEFDLPLHETIADQYAAGMLHPADGESASALADAGYRHAADPAAAPASDDGNDDVPASLEERINAVASHADANTLAAELDVDGFEAKKPGLDAKRAALHAARIQKEEQGEA